MTLGQAIGATPDLERGLCIGQWDLFDVTDDPPEVDQAVELCQICPVLIRCRQWVSSLPPSKRPCGVVAGALHLWEPQRKWEHRMAAAR